MLAFGVSSLQFNIFEVYETNVLLVSNRHTELLYSLGVIHCQFLTLYVNFNFLNIKPRRLVFRKQMTIDADSWRRQIYIA